MQRASPVIAHHRSVTAASLRYRGVPNLSPPHLRFGTGVYRLLRHSPTLGLAQPSDDLDDLEDLYFASGPSSCERDLGCALLRAI